MSDRSLAAQALIGDRSYENSDRRRKAGFVCGSGTVVSNRRFGGNRPGTSGGNWRGTGHRFAHARWCTRCGSEGFSRWSIDPKALQPILALYAQRGVTVPCPKSRMKSFCNSCSIQELRESVCCKSDSAGHNQPVPGDKRFRFSATSDSTGHFTIQNVLPGTYSIRRRLFSCPQLLRFPIRLQLPRPHKRRRCFHDAGATVSGRVTDGSGQPLVNGRRPIPFVPLWISRDAACRLKETNDQGNIGCSGSPGIPVCSLSARLRPAATTTTAQPSTAAFPPLRLLSGNNRGCHVGAGDGTRKNRCLALISCYDPETFAFR